MRAIEDDEVYLQEVEGGGGERVENNWMRVLGTFSKNNFVLPKLKILKFFAELQNDMYRTVPYCTIY